MPTENPKAKKLLARKKAKGKPLNTPQKQTSYSVYEEQFLLNNRLEDLQKLIELRGGRMNSYREKTLWQIHNILLQLNYTQAEKQHLLYALNCSFTEPLPTAEIDRILSQTNFYNNLLTSYIIEILDITPEEQEHLKALVAPELKTLKSREKQKQNRKLQKQQKLDQRLQKVAEMAKANCTQAEIAKELDLSVRTIKNCYKLLGISKQKSSSRNAVVVLRDQGFSQLEVAEKLKISIRTVRKYWSVQNPKE